MIQDTNDENEDLQAFLDLEKEALHENIDSSKAKHIAQNLNSFADIDPQSKQNVENFAYNQVLSQNFRDSQLADNLLQAVSQCNQVDRKLSDFTNDLSHTIRKISHVEKESQFEDIFNREKHKLIKQEPQPEDISLNHESNGSLQLLHR